jgi:hypothetical protein
MWMEGAMVAGLVLASLIEIAGQPVSNRHVRTPEARILAIVEEGVAESATFRRLVETLDASDVIVYLEPKLDGRGLGGYLSHRMVVAGPMRYLKIAVDLRGGRDRLVALVAHELQHAVEVAEASEVRDSQSMVRLFERRTIAQSCGGGCFETAAALDVQEAVLAELRPRRAVSVTAGLP